MGAVMEHKPTKIGVCLMMDNGTYITSYFGNCQNPDLSRMAYYIQADIMMDIAQRVCRDMLDRQEE